MIYASPGEQFTAILYGGAEGLVGDITLQVEETDGDTAFGPTTAGIIEVEPEVYVGTGPSPATKGTYVIVWVDPDGNRAVEELLVTHTPPEAGAGNVTDWEPATADVAALIPARVKEPGIGNVDDFSTNTFPTKTAVEAKIRMAVKRVSSAVGREPCEADLREDAGAAAALYAAMLVEQGYWPEQSVAGQSSFKNLESLWKESIKTLTEAVGERCGGAGGDSVSAGGQMPREGSDDWPLIGRTTVDW